MKRLDKPSIFIKTAGNWDFAQISLSIAYRYFLDTAIFGQTLKQVNYHILPTRILVIDLVENLWRWHLLKGHNTSKLKIKRERMLDGRTWVQFWTDLITAWIEQPQRYWIYICFTSVRFRFFCLSFSWSFPVFRLLIVSFTVGNFFS